jgi:spermidine synthase
MPIRVTSRSIAARTAVLLFGSGLCALVYQTVWLREFRLVFGSSTPATAAVLAIFMGGLGVGSAWLGPRADRHPNPLRFYGQLEILIALSAALTPFLLALVRKLYVAAGGTTAMGAFLGTSVRLVLAVLVLAVPTVLMGATLPAAIRSATDPTDRSRGTLALLYGVNTLGAVSGVVIATFFALERLGNRGTLWLACLLNVVIGLIAAIYFSVGSAPRVDEQASSEPPTATTRFIWLSAFAVGFVFFAAELVWYRMLTPLLGGTTFTFGLILAVVLLGIGLGSTTYVVTRQGRRGTLGAFAITCAVEALCLAIPFALGDRIAVLTLLLRPLGSVGFHGLVAGWTLVVGIVVFPVAFAAGYQFPLLVSILGEGREAVGRHIGRCYAWNTGGAIAGAIAGGFGLLPLLTATGVWRAGGAVLIALSLAAALFDTRMRQRLIAVALCVAGAALLMMQGPTAAWRHSPIGAGRADRIVGDASRNRIRDWLHQRRRVVEKEYDGIETGVALSADDGYAFVLGGKIDGHARFDAGTQVMFGMVGAALHPRPESAFVIGLGTGSSAGWLGAIPGMQRVDVVELEPAILDVARASTPVNMNVLSNPKVHVEIGDARELMLTRRAKYDLIVSEPSNPYRAGVSSLFTKEFYDVVASHLEEGGLFLQWTQLYEIDSVTLRTVYATLKASFPYVETWQTQHADLLFVASAEPIQYEADRLRARLAAAPFAQGLDLVWRASGLEGFLGHYVTGNRVAELMARDMAVNTDDRNALEFGFARLLGRTQLLDVTELFGVAQALGENRPAVLGTVDWTRVDAERMTASAASGTPPSPMRSMTEEQLRLAQMYSAYLRGDYAGTLATWRALGRGPINSMEMLTLAEALADAGNGEAERAAAQLRGTHPIEADLVLARLYWRQQREQDAIRHLKAALTAYGRDPWPFPAAARQALALCLQVAARDRAVAVQLAEILRRPFAVKMWEEARKATALGVVVPHPNADCAPAALPAIEAYEPHVPWNADLLRVRAKCYRAFRPERAAAAEADVAAYRRGEPAPLGDLVPR